MKIIADKAAKRFNRDWIFRDFSFSFTPGGKYAITGPNGSGKSTLLQVIAGSMNTTKGSIRWEHNGEVPSEKVYAHLSIAAPYLELVEEFSAVEFLEFHTVFKPLTLPVSQILAAVGLDHTAGKQIRNYSSGMKQRLKLAQAIFSDTTLLLLDEPCTNLDASGYEMYRQLVQQYCNHRTVIVSSNDPAEYSFCTETVSILNYK